MFSFILVYIIYALLITIGLVGVLVCDNLFKRLISLAVLQSGILFFYISICYESGLKIPIINNKHLAHQYINPVPQVLMLTAIVVGLSTTAVGLSLLIKISKFYYSILESEIRTVKKCE